MWPKNKKQQKYYHISPTYLPAGLVLQPTKYAGDDEHLLVVAHEALDMGTNALRLLNLVEDLISFSGRVNGQGSSETVDFASVVNEVILERVRERDFGDRPRRIGGVFLFPDIKHAERFRLEMRDGGGVMVECSVGSARTFAADLSLIQRPDLHGDIRRELVEAEQRASAYWSGELGRNALVEVLADGEVEVIETLEVTE